MEYDVMIRTGGGTPPRFYTILVVDASHEN